jgi:hypothetical protein
MRRTTPPVFTLLALVLAGAQAAPHCEQPRECELMWSAAQQALSAIATMRTRIATDTRVETFAPNGYGHVGGIVTKVPTGAVGYDFRLELECYRSTDCRSIQASGEKLFDSLLLSAAGKQPEAEPPVKEWTPAPLTSSKSVLQVVESMPEARACNPQPRALLIGQRPGAKTVTVACNNGDALAVGCDDSNACHVLK